MTSASLPRTAGTPGVRLVRPQVSTEALALLVSLYFSICCNGPFWHAVRTAPGNGAGIVLSLLVAVTALHWLLLCLVATRWTVKPACALLIIAAAFATYYMDAFGVYVDSDMVRNVLHTDMRESRELLTPDLFLHLIGYAVLPLLALWALRLRPRSWKRAATLRAAALSLALLAAAGSTVASFQGVSALMRNDKALRYLITPGNVIVGVGQNLVAQAAPAGPRIPVGADARQALRPAGARSRLVVLVVGETARAANWGLDGYARQTTPRLARTDAVNFSHVSACGSSTEVSLPCMFSPFGRRDYDERAIRSHESLLDVTARAGIATRWRDNQSGCKGVCAGVPFESVADAGDPQLCNGTRCLDGILLSGLQAEIDGQPGDMLVVLHQLGNHGPAYFQRYPASHRRFTPTCDTEELGRCSREAIVNSYDNALLYTDTVLADAIALLAAQRDRDTALIYVSDHGESLGDHGLYLHGVPYAMAPEEQLHVPMLVWLSPGFQADSGITRDCLLRGSGAPVSHDNLFHSVLGILDVQTRAYDASLDIFARCGRSTALAGAAKPAQAVLHAVAAERL